MHATIKNKRKNIRERIFSRICICIPVGGGRYLGSRERINNEKG